MKLSIILPTYNNEKTLYECLEALDKQDYSKKEYEILLIDGGSTDSTLEIAKKFNVRILKNPDRVEDAARIFALRIARGEIIALIDADNIVVGKDWIRKMLEPFKDKEIFYADTLYFACRSKDPMKVRYQALIGGDDPLATYLGFYSRWCYFKNNWTDFPYTYEKKKGHIKVKITDSNLIPTIGSNGFLIRKNLLRKFIKKTFTHPDYILEMVKKGYNCFAKVDTGIVHNQPTFFKSKIRRIQRRLSGEIKIKYNYSLTKWKIIKTFLHIATILPITYDITKGYINKPDSAWFFHYFACFGLIFIHGYYKLTGLFKRRKFFDIYDPEETSK